ncbi:MAG: K(+)-transporting ATPase subunit C [Chitinophagales bacterium]|nr:K(+)-transporting ATPase subunit C [Chitinophagales bacterium]
MKTYLKSSILLTLVLVIITAVIYPLAVRGIAYLSPGQGRGVTIEKDGKVVGYANIGQKFTDDKYFWGRPSAVDYNAAGSAGSNKGPSNPDYLKTVQERIDTFLAHNPGISKSQIPAEMVTASGSGLDPNISLQSALIQVPRVAKVRGIAAEQLTQLVQKQKEGALLGFLGPDDKINVLQLNIELDKLTSK